MLQTHDQMPCDAAMLYRAWAISQSPASWLTDAWVFGEFDETMTADMVEQNMRDRLAARWNISPQDVLLIDVQSHADLYRAGRDSNPCHRWLEITHGDAPMPYITPDEVELLFDLPETTQAFRGMHDHMMVEVVQRVVAWRAVVSIGEGLSADKRLVLVPAMQWVHHPIPTHDADAVAEALPRLLRMVNVVPHGASVHVDMVQAMSEVPPSVDGISHAWSAVNDGCSPWPDRCTVYRLLPSTLGDYMSRIRRQLDTAEWGA